MVWGTWGTVVVAILLAGCAVEERADWHGDRRFTGGERARIEEGTTWLRARAGLPLATIAWDLEVAGDDPLPGTIRRQRGPVTEHGAAGACLGGAVYIDPSDPGIGGEANLAGLAAHEMAHCELGFVDAYHAGEEQSDGIMRVLSPMRWTSSEEAQCARNADRCPSGAIGTSAR